MEAKDKAHLEWIYHRMANQHNENKNVDYMHKFRSILDSLSTPTNQQRGLDLNKLEQKLDKSLEKETPESLKKFLSGERVTDSEIGNKADSYVVDLPEDWNRLDNKSSFEKGYKQAITDRLSQLPEGEGWISVEDRLPEKKPLFVGQSPYIVSTEEGRIFATNYTALGWADLYGKTVTHWQPLPEPPNTK